MESERMMTKEPNRPSRNTLNCESTFIDKILFPLTALVFLVLFTVLLFGNAGNAMDGNPSYDATCGTPKEFSGIWIRYTNQYCSSSRAKVTRHLDDLDTDLMGSRYTIDPETNETIYNPPKTLSRDEVFETAVAQNKSTVRTSKLLLFMVMLSLIPPIAWHLLKGIDGNGLATLEYRKRGTQGKGSAGYFTMIWYVLCQILMLVIIFVIFYQLHSHLEVNFTQKKNSLYNNETSGSDIVNDMVDSLHEIDPYYNEPKWVEPGRVDEEGVFCKFTIRILGGNIQRYTVQCNLKRTVAGSYEYLVLIVSKYWTVLVLSVTILNALITVGLALVAFAKNSVLEWYLGYKVSSTFATLVNWPDVYVGLLASRRGETRSVVEVLTNANESVNMQLDNETKRKYYAH